MKKLLLSALSLFVVSVFSVQFALADAAADLQALLDSGTSVEDAVAQMIEEGQAPADVIAAAVSAVGDGDLGGIVSAALEAGVTAEDVEAALVSAGVSSEAASAAVASAGSDAGMEAAGEGEGDESPYNNVNTSPSGGTGGGGSNTSPN